MFSAGEIIILFVEKTIGASWKLFSEAELIIQKSAKAFSLNEKTAGKFKAFRKNDGVLSVGDCQRNCVTE